MARLAHLIAASSSLAAFCTFTGCSSAGDASPVDEANATASAGDGGGAEAQGAAACAAGRACGTTCCAGAEVCSFQKCFAPGAACVDSSDCSADRYCEYASAGAGASDASVPPSGADAAMCSGAAAQKGGVCVPRPPVCAAGTAPSSGGITCLEMCEYKGTSTFQPALKFAWGGKITAPFSTDVMMTPIVIELDDDNCDGKVTEADIPEIVFTSFTGGDYRQNGTLHAISVVRGAVVEKWQKPGAVSPGGQLAAGNIDGKPGNEVVACGDDGLVHAYNGDGSLLWKTPAKVACRMPSIADLDGDGKVEVIVDGAILVGATGATKAAFSEPLGGTFVVSDLDGDGKLDVITAGQAFDANGQLFVSTDDPGSFPAIGDFDKDGKPEVVVIDTKNHSASFWHYDAAAPKKFTWVRQNVDINGKISPDRCPGLTVGGGPPTVADFDGDGVPDVAVAGGVGYTVLNGAKAVNPAIANGATILWSVATQDCSSAATGSSVFDFDGDGKAEVVYSDERHLRIYEGPTGKVLFETCNTTGTLIEYPVIADVDNDGHADIVVVSNSYGNASATLQCKDGKGISQSGVRVFGDVAGSWVRTRRVWNEHAYHVTNVSEDGTIPAHELSNWKETGLNNFRQNKQPGSEFAAPDAVVSVSSQCGGTFGLVATVTNIGEAALPEGVSVGFYSGAPGSSTLLGKVSTTHALYAAQSENVTLSLATPPSGVQDGSVKVFAIVDDTMTPHGPWHECRTDNNTSAVTAAVCSVVK